MRDLGTHTGLIHVTGRPPVYIMRGVPGLNPRTLVGEVVLLDGKAQKIVGVETYAMPDECVTGLQFGIQAVGDDVVA